MATAIHSDLSSRTQAVVFCGLTIALMVVSAWVTIPIGPVPFTLQTFVMIFALLFLKPGQCLASVTIYVLLGMIGLPVFSGMRGGIGVLIGPTGGFLWGFILGAIVAIAIMKLIGRLPGDRTKDGGRLSGSAGQANGVLTKVIDRRRLAISFAAAISFLVILYLCGWISLVLIAGFSPVEAFLVGVAPFVLIDAIKMVAAVLTSEAVSQAILRR